MKKVLLAIATIAFSSLAFAAPPSDESIQELMEVTDSKKLMDGAMAQMDSIVESSMQQASAGREISPEDQKVIKEMGHKMAALMKNEFSWEKLSPAIIQMYKQSLTQSEVDGMLDFYRSDAGKAMVAKMPVIMQETMKLMQKKSMEIAPEVQKIQQEAAAKIEKNNQQ